MKSFIVVISLLLSFAINSAFANTLHPSCQQEFEIISSEKLNEVLREDFRISDLVERNKLQEAAWELREKNYDDLALQLENRVARALQSEKVINEAEVTNSILTAGQSKFLTLENGLRGIFKPDIEFWTKMPFKPFSDASYFAKAIRFEAEVVAYQFGRELGVNVPVTIKKIYKGSLGSFQVLVHQDSSPVQAHERLKMEAFDFLINNVDRTESNTFHSRGRVIAIDHGLAFRPKKSYVHKQVKLLKDLHLTKEVEDFYIRLKERLTPEKTHELLSEDFPKDIIDEVVERRQKLLEKYEVWKASQGGFST